MDKLKVYVYLAAVSVFGLCLYSFLIGTKMIEGDDNSIPIYFLAKGIFCSVSLYLSYQLLATLRKRSI